MNGRVTSMDVIRDTPLEKNYRINALMAVDPDLRHFPFDNHSLPILIEPMILDEDQLLIVIDQDETGLDKEAKIPGWTFTAPAILSRTGPVQLVKSRTPGRPSATASSGTARQLS
jgi:hypothetical protein